MNTTYQATPIRLAKHIGLWLFFLVCVFYGIYALALGVTELLHLLGIVDDARTRAAPLLFVIHAFSGSVVLISGPLQFNRLLRYKRRTLHRVLGRAMFGQFGWQVLAVCGARYSLTSTSPRKSRLERLPYSGSARRRLPICVSGI
jgi:hypothetical protein